MSVQYGYSLPELLISLFLFSSLMLALFSLQLSARRWSDEARQYAFASRMMQDMSERIRVNHKALQHYRLDSSEAPALSIDCRTSPCTAQQLAAFDLWQWQQWLHGEQLQINGRALALLPQLLACISIDEYRLRMIISWRQHDAEAQNVATDCHAANGRHRMQREVLLFTGIDA